LSSGPVSDFDNKSLAGDCVPSNSLAIARSVWHPSQRVILRYPLSSDTYLNTRIAIVSTQ